MRICLLSDLHLEFTRDEMWRPSPVDADVVILAGDIDLHLNGLEWARWAFDHWPKPPTVLYVAGNHEYYQTSLQLLSAMQQPAWAMQGVTFLEQESIEVGNVRFLGCTLWSGFSLYGAEQIGASMAAAEQSIADYRVISADGDRVLSGRDTLRLHEKAVRWLDETLAQPFDGKTVVITHFAPHPGCVAPEYEGSELTPYFVTDLSHLMQKYRIDLWCYGHTHTNADFIAENGCRVVSNQRGYPNERVVGSRIFDPGLSIAL